MRKLEMRLAVPEGTSTSEPRLQVRHLETTKDAKPNALGSGYAWSEWEDVPIVVVKDLHAKK